MTRVIRFLTAVSLFIILFSSAVCTQTLADTVKHEFLHAWNGYTLYARGHDELNPLRGQPHDWYGRSLCMTPVDAYDGLLLMGFVKEAALAKKLILDSLSSFDKNIEVQVFEVNIRLVGGLLSAYQLDGDRRFLTMAEDLAKRLLPAFNSSTGMPYRFVNLHTGKVRDSLNNPAEIGTALLEFGELTKFTNDSVYYLKAKNAAEQVYNRRSPLGLVGTTINVETGKWVDTISHIGGMIDSYYEYLLKSWILFGDRNCRGMFIEHYKAINTYLADTTHGGLWYGQAGMYSGKRTGTRFGSLEAFFPAVLALCGDTARAKKLEESCFTMWNLYNIEPEEIDYATMKPTEKGYYLRPEIIESAYYLYHFTGNPVWKKMGEKMFRDIMKYCRTDDAYAMLTDVTTKKKGDRMQSFFLAETLKYCFLLFSPPDVLPFDQTIFNTEAHPFARNWK